MFGWIYSKFGLIASMAFTAGGRSVGHIWRACPRGLAPPPNRWPAALGRCALSLPIAPAPTIPAPTVPLHPPFLHPPFLPPAVLAAAAAPLQLFFINRIAHLAPSAMLHGRQEPGAGWVPLPSWRTFVENARLRYSILLSLW